MKQNFREVIRKKTPTVRKYLKRYLREKFSIVLLILGRVKRFLKYILLKYIL